METRSKAQSRQLNLIPRRPIATKSLVLCARDIRITSGTPSLLARARIFVAISAHNPRGVIRRVLVSAIDQGITISEFGILIVDDSSSDRWQMEVQDLLQNPQILTIRGQFGSPARTRNAALDYIDREFPCAEWVARLDADDCFSTPTSLWQAVEIGDKARSKYVLGGNRLIQNGQLLEKQNPALPQLKCPGYVLETLKKMALGTAENELPSCNLLLRTRTGFRYPEVLSAEDHFLVTQLLLLHSTDGALLLETFFVDYTLSGNATSTNLNDGHYFASRKYLYDSATLWAETIASGKRVLGYGQEGIVTLENDVVTKTFYSDSSLAALSNLECYPPPGIPHFRLDRSNNLVTCSYRYTQSIAVTEIYEREATELMQSCLESGYTFLNIKRPNFQRTSDGELLFIDIGKDIVAATIDSFLDMSARLFAISHLGWPDNELQRRPASLSQEHALGRIPGFSEFYRNLLIGFAETQWEVNSLPVSKRSPAKDVSLMIKCCPMDADFLEAQVHHLIRTLESPRPFAERILLIDPFDGPYLRQHANGQGELLLEIANRLKHEGWIDSVLIAPKDATSVTEINRRWFDLDSSATHTIRNIPTSSQLWGFEQAKTRYLLQCDVDILVGKRDWKHDYLSEMRTALKSDGTVCVAFNIPKRETAEPSPYTSPLEGNVPEVRCGLLDLERLFQSRPWPNYLMTGSPALSWYRSLEKHQRHKGLRTLRGGDPRTFYIHPPNSWKRDKATLKRIRSMVEQSQLPACQIGKWDLAGNESDWIEPSRREKIILLIKGRNTPPDKIRRCIQSLTIQTDQDFGAIIVDDASNQVESSRAFAENAKELEGRATLIRNTTRKGHLSNITRTASQVCKNPESLIVILDADDALIRKDAVSKLRQRYDKGHDIVLAGCFRPDKPLKSYHPDFSNPRQLGGGEVWIHLRSFRKSLIDELPQEHLKNAGDWIQECTDYALMIPLVELCQNPAFIPEYLVWHERSGSTTPEDRERKDTIIRKILAKPAMQRSYRHRSGSPPAIQFQ